QARQAAARARHVRIPARGGRGRSRRRRCCRARRAPRCASHPASASAAPARRPGRPGTSARRRLLRARRWPRPRSGAAPPRRTARCPGGWGMRSCGGVYPSPVTARADMAGTPAMHAVALRIKALAREAGFRRCGISGVELGEDEAHLRDWLAQGLHGTMDWMARHGDKRARPPELVPGTRRVVSVGLDYGQDPDQARDTLADGQRAYVARYALGRDYHRLMRN